MSVAVVGLGNLILSDEGVGVHVVRRLAETHTFPEDVVLIDGGTSAIDLLDQLVEAEHIIFIDADRPGALSRWKARGSRSGFASARRRTRSVSPISSQR